MSAADAVSVIETYSSSTDTADTHAGWLELRAEIAAWRQDLIARLDRLTATERADQ